MRCTLKILIGTVHSKVYISSKTVKITVIKMEMVLENKKNSENKFSKYLRRTGYTLIAAGVLSAPSITMAQQTYANTATQNWNHRSPKRRIHHEQRHVNNEKEQIHDEERHIRGEQRQIEAEKDHIKKELRENGGRMTPKIREQERDIRERERKVRGQKRTVDHQKMVAHRQERIIHHQERHLHNRGHQGPGHIGPGNHGHQGQGHHPVGPTPRPGGQHMGQQHWNQGAPRNFGGGSAPHMQAPAPRAGGGRRR